MTTVVLGCCVQDALRVPKLSGYMTSINGTFAIDAQTEPLGSFDVIPGGFLSMMDTYVSVDLAAFVPGAGIPDMLINASGDVRIGGANGFLCSVGGSLDTETGEARLHVSHAGGWEPIPGVSFLVTPAFSGDFALGVPNGPHIAVSAAAAWLGPVELGTSLVALVAHPASSSPGMKLAVELTQQEQGGAYEYLLTAEGGLRLFGDGPRAPPVLGLAGSISSSGDASFTFETVEEWVPLAGLIVSTPF